MRDCPCEPVKATPRKVCVRYCHLVVRSFSLIGRKILGTPCRDLPSDVYLEITSVGLALRPAEPKTPLQEECVAVRQEDLGINLSSRKEEKHVNMTNWLMHTQMLFYYSGQTLAPWGQTLSPTLRSPAVLEWLLSYLSLSCFYIIAIPHIIGSIWLLCVCLHMRPSANSRNLPPHLTWSATWRFSEWLTEP